MMNTPSEQGALTTADLAATARTAAQRNTQANDGRWPAERGQEDRLVPLFHQDVAKDFRSRWDAVQSSFVDDPQNAVRRGDELVAQVIKSLAESFADKRAELEGQWGKEDEESTENLRLAFRRYRSFFERLLSL